MSEWTAGGSEPALLSGGVESESSVGGVVSRWGGRQQWSPGGGWGGRSVLSS